MKTKSTVLPTLDPPAALTQARSTILDLEVRLTELSAVADGSERRAGELHAQERELVDALTEARAEALARPGREHAETITEIEHRLADVAEKLGTIAAELAPHRRAVELVERDLAEARQRAQEAEETVLDAWWHEVQTKAEKQLCQAVTALYTAHRVRHPAGGFNPRDWGAWCVHFLPGLDTAIEAAGDAPTTIRSRFDAPQ